VYAGKARVLLLDAPAARADAWRPALEAAGYRVAVPAPAVPAPDVPAADVPVPDVIVLTAAAASERAFAVLATLRDGDAATVPVVVVVSPGALEDGLRAAIEGAVRCLAEPVEPGALVAALDAVLAPDALPAVDQRRRSRQRALEVLARIEARGAASDDDVHPRLVHLTRLEHAPRRASEPDLLADARGRLTTLTPKQRALLALVEAEGGVTATAARLETSRGNVYAGLRRIVHRLGMRNTGELLRCLGSGELLHPVGA
jgi:DNA-binding NarL/FixJ family response regulator